MILYRSAILVLLFSGLAFGSPTFRLGAIFPMTGSIATYGEENVNSLKLFFDELNEKGGINGVNVELLIEDNRGESTDAINSINKLISVDHLKVIFGTPSSGNTLAIAPIAQRNQVTLLSPSGTSSRIPASGDHIGHVCFTDEYQARVMAKYAYETLKKRKIGVFEDKTSDYSLGLSQAFKKHFADLGGQIVAEDFGYSSGDRDFRSMLVKLKKHNPDGLYLPGYYTQGGMIISQARSLGATYTILGADGFDSPVLNKVVGRKMGEVYFTTHFALDDVDPAVQAFVEKYSKRYGSRPGAQAALAYDAAGIVASALKSCRYPCQDLSKYLFQAKNFQGVTGTISFDSGRNAIKDVVMIQIIDGKNKFVGRILP